MTEKDIEEIIENTAPVVSLAGYVTWMWSWKSALGILASPDRLNRMTSRGPFNLSPLLPQNPQRMMSLFNHTEQSQYSSFHS